MNVKGDWSEGFEPSESRGLPTFSLYAQEGVDMFARVVSVDLKPDSAAEFTRTIDNEIIPLLRKQKGFEYEITFVTPNGTEAVGISLWDDRENAQAYYRTTYPQVLALLSKVIEGVPVVMNYKVANSTLHKVVDRAESVV
jgi:quinol monooxygenase YgiN